MYFIMSYTLEMQLPMQQCVIPEPPTDQRHRETVKKWFSQMSASTNDTNRLTRNKTNNFFQLCFKLFFNLTC